MEPAIYYLGQRGLLELLKATNNEDKEELAKFAEEISQQIGKEIRLEWTNNREFRIARMLVEIEVGREEKLELTKCELDAEPCRLKYEGLAGSEAEDRKKVYSILERYYAILNRKKERHIANQKV